MRKIEYIHPHSLFFMTRTSLFYHDSGTSLTASPSSRAINSSSFIFSTWKLYWVRLNSLQLSAWMLMFVPLNIVACWSRQRSAKCRNSASLL